MKKTAVVYWSGTGNTEAMANAVAEGAKAAGAEVTVLTAGDGEWMHNWEEDCLAAGAKQVAESVICNEAPDADALAACRALGAKLAE